MWISQGLIFVWVHVLQWCVFSGRFQKLILKHIVPNIVHIYMHIVSAYVVTFRLKSCTPRLEETHLKICRTIQWSSVTEVRPVGCHVWGFDACLLPRFALGCSTTCHPWRKWSWFGQWKCKPLDMTYWICCIICWMNSSTCLLQRLGWNNSILAESAPILKTSPLQPQRLNPSNRRIGPLNSDDGWSNEAVDTITVTWMNTAQSDLLVVDLCVSPACPLAPSRPWNQFLLSWSLCAPT